MPRRLESRDGDIWRGYLLGKTQVTLAEEFGISHQRVSQIVAAARADCADPELSTARREHLEVMRMLQATAVEIMDTPVPPAYSNGRPVLDEDGTMVRDYSTRLAALDRVAKTQERLAKVLGLDAPIKAEVTVDASRATAEAAADALSYVMGDAGE
jgi:uncharacterized protein (DUF2336 family)